MEAHQELVGHLERSSGRMRALSAVTVVVALYFAAVYVFQLLLPWLGTESVTVNLADPAIKVTEVIVLALALAWLYVGAKDYLFSTRVRRVVRQARTEEKKLKDRLPSEPSEPESA